MTKDELIDFILTYEESGRNKIGQGTKKGKMLKKLTTNHINILKVFDDCRLQGRGMFSIKALRSYLYEKRIWRYDRSGKYECCYWDYHKLQATCSILVGKGLLTMTDFQYSGFDQETGEFVVRPAPQYYATFEQSKWYRQIVKSGGKILENDGKYFK